MRPLIPPSLVLIACATACGGKSTPKDTAQTPSPEAADAAEASTAADAKPTESPPRSPERWVAVLTAGLNKIELVIHFTPADDGTWEATLDVPAQKAHGIPLKDVAHSDEALAFTLDKPQLPGANEVYRAARDPAGAATASGTMTIGGHEIPFTMRRLAAGEAFTTSMKRPQTPKPPYPYDTRELVTTNAKDGVKRAGVLSIPKGDGPFPVLIIESGSGPQDRDGTLGGHKPYLVIGDHLARHGIASYRTDDRGVGGSTGVDKDATYADLTGDVLAMVAELAKQPEIDPRAIGVAGHSQGGAIAPMAAVRSDAVAFVVMICGMGVPGTQVMADQKHLILASQGITGERLAKIDAHQRKLLQMVVDDADDDAFREHLAAGLELELTPAQRAQMTPEVVSQLVEAGLQQIRAPFLVALINNDPATYLTQVKVPLLAIFGEKDLQVEPVSNAAGVTEHLAAAGNTAATVWTVPRMSHTLQETETGRLEEHAENEESVRPIVLEKLVSWIRALPTRPGARPPQ